MLNNYVLSLTYNFRCIKTTSPTYSVDDVNNMNTVIYSYGSSRLSTSSSIESEQLIKMLKLEDVKE